jgi:signal peptidase
MLLLTTVGSLALWIAIPWVALGWSPTLVTSGSMTPVVTPGDVVMIRPAQDDELSPNTVVLYDRPDTGPILHRIVAVLPDGTLQTRGDANASPDSAPVRSSDVRGVAVLRVPWVGRPSLWLYQGRTGPLAVVGVLALSMIALAPRAFDPAYDPWANTRRVRPAEVLLGRGSGSRARPADSGSHLLPRLVHDRVLERLAAQSADAQSRTAQLLEGLS